MGGISTGSLADGGNFYVNVDAGQADYSVASTYNIAHCNLYIGGNPETKDTAGALRFGYRWHSVADFGVEAGYVDLVSPCGHCRDLPTTTTRMT